MNAFVSPGGRRLAWWLFLTGIALYLTVSAQALFALGVPYDAPGGPIVAKLHPGTYVLLLAYTVALVSHGNPLRVGLGQLARQPLLAVYLVSIVLIFVYSVARYGSSGAAFIIDTLLMPALCALTLMMFEADRRHACLAMVVALLVVNTLIGIGESLVHVRLVPLNLGGRPEVIEEIFRPSALLGHPLANAIITAALLPAALFLRLPMSVRCVIMLLLWVGVLAFGGRTSFVLATLAFGLYFSVQIAAAVSTGRFNYMQLVGGSFGAVVGAALVTGSIVASGIGQRIFMSFTWDSSAAVRERIWDVFVFLSTEDMIFGVSPADITDLILRLGLTGPGETIENFWLVMFLQLGAVGFVPFVVAMACVGRWLWKATSSGAMRVAVLFFFVSASSNNSLASKSVSLTLLFVAVAASRRLGAAPVPVLEQRPQPAPLAFRESPR